MANTDGGFTGERCHVERRKAGRMMLAPVENSAGAAKKSERIAVGVSWNDAISIRCSCMY